VSDASVKLDGSLALVAVAIGWEARHLAEHGREAHELPRRFAYGAALAVVVGFVAGFCTVRSITEDESLGVLGGVIAADAALYALQGWAQRSQPSAPPVVATPVTSTPEPPVQAPALPSPTTPRPRTAARIPGAY
jgi:hypothetical protein